MSANEPEPLLSAAESIADGTEVLWARLLDDAGMDAGVAQALQAIGKIAAFHRGMSSTETKPIESAHASGSIETWGHLALRGKIDEGAFGSVYRARDPNLQIEVALKLVANREGHQIDVARALREARLLARVRHPNVVQVYGADIIEGRVGIWMELIHGRTLASLINANGPLGAREAALIGIDLCQALAAVHAANLIHGDVKARNVMREAGGRIVLMDFGTSKDLGIQPPGLDVAGTPLYLAPEVFRGETRSRVTDIYSLGVLLFHLVSTSYPVNGSTQADVEEAHKRGGRIRLRDIRPDLPPRFIEAIETAIAPAPADRFQSVGEFESALLRSLERPVPRVQPRTYWLLAAIAAVAIAAVAGARYWIDLRAARTTSQETLTGAPVSAGRGVAAAASTYQIDAGFYRLRGTTETRLHSGDRVAPGDRLFAKLHVSTPAFVYIVNEDDQGQMFLLFPLPGQTVENPITSGTSTRVPGTPNGDVTWQITSVGGREHFLVFASPERLDAFEDLFASLPRPTFGQPVTSGAISPQIATKLRSVGGLVQTAVGGLAQQPGQTSAAPLASIFSSPLGDREETAHGLWIRQLTVENPTKP
jgi:serine/threonine-protein kinase